jgi:hypothetical protein
MWITNVKLATALASWRAVRPSATSRWSRLCLPRRALAAKTTYQKFHEVPLSSFNIYAMMPRGGENILIFYFSALLVAFRACDFSCAMGAGKEAAAAFHIQ